MAWKALSAALVAACLAAAAGGIAQSPSSPAATPPPNPLAERFREAVKVADRQVASTPEWMRIHAGFVVQDWASMLADARKLAARFPASADLQVAIAVALAGGGDLAQATAALERAVALQPGNKAALAMLAQLQLAQDRFADAARTFEQALEVRPGDLGVMMSLADAYARGGEPARAAAVLRQVTVLAPDSVPAWVGYLDVATRAGNAEPARVEFNQLRITRPGTAAAILSRLPGGVLAAMPTPIPPTPRPTPRTDTPRLVMASGPTGGQGGQQPKIWNEAALGFEAKVAAIAARARPLIELVERYDLTCQGGSARRPGAAQPSPEGTAGEAGAAPVEVDWKMIWSRTAAWTDAAANAPTSECRVLASDILSLANATRSALEKAVQSTAGAGIPDTDQKQILQKYNLLW